MAELIRIGLDGLDGGGGERAEALAGGLVGEFVGGPRGGAAA